MNYYFPKNHSKNASLEKMVADPLFQKIVDYLLLHKNERIILRQLKADLEKETPIEPLIEKMVENKVIKRKERQYFLNFPIFTGEEQEKLLKKFQVDIPEFARSLNHLQTIQFLGETLWNQWFPKDIADYFFAIDETQQIPYYQKLVAGNQLLQFVSIQEENTLPYDLATYFKKLQTNELPEKFLSLQQLVGDVDINYFIQQTKKYFSSERKKKVSAKKNIFLETLLEVKAVQKVDNEIQPVKPVFYKAEIVGESKLLGELSQKLDDFFEGAEDLNQLIFIRQTLYTFLVKELMGAASEHFDYVLIL